MEDRETARMRKHWESKTTRIMMATVPHVTSGLGLKKISGRWIFVDTSVPYQRDSPANYPSCIRHEVIATVDIYIHEVTKPLALELVYRLFSALCHQHLYFYLEDRAHIFLRNIGNQLKV